MSELTREDIISDDAIKAPLILADNLEKAEAVLIRMRKSSIKIVNDSESVTSMRKLSESVTELTAEKKELEKVEKQLATAQAKNNAQYIEMKKRVDEANQVLKEKVKLGEADSTTVNKQNASITKLEAALRKNRQAYASLTNEEQRNGKQGRELLKVIQQQDKDFKELSKTMGQHQAEVGNYGLALEGLDGAAGGVVTRFKTLGSQLLALMKSPVVLALAAIAAVFYTMKEAAESYYKSTIEGEEALQKETLRSQAFWKVYEDSWANIGKHAADLWEGLKQFWRGFATTFASDEQMKRLEGIFKRADELTAQQAKTQKEHIRDVVDDAKTELRVAELLEISKNKLKYTDEERLAALREANRLINEQAQGDVELAQQDLKNERDRLALLGKRIEGFKSVAELTDQQMKDTGLTTEELQKLAEMEATVLKVREAASAKRKANSRAEATTVNEIHQDKIAKLNAEVDATVAARQAELDAGIKAIQDEVIQGRMIKKDGDEKIAYLQKQFTDDLIQSNIDGLSKMLLSEELTAEERAAIEKKLAQLKIDLNTAVYDQVVQLDEVVVKSGKSALEKLYPIYEEFSQSIAAIFDGLTARRLENIDKEIEALDRKTEAEVKNAGDNDAAVAAIEANAEKRREQLEIKKIEAMRKQAAIEKSFSLIKLAIQTAIDISKIKSSLAAANAAALIFGPLVAPGIIAANTAAAATQIALASISSALAAAAIAAQPLPAFAVGTDNAPEGLAIVGEKGPELKITPGGVATLTPGKPTLDYLEAGTKIIPHKETMRMLAMSSFGNQSFIHREQSQQIELARSLKQIEKNTRNMGKSSSGNLFKQGILTYEQKVKEDGSKQLIRRTNLGY